MYRNEIEALLFSAGKNLTVDAIATLIDGDRRTVLKDLKALQVEYNGRDSALTILQEGELWKIHVREKYLPLVQKIVADTELPRAVLETLAVIAYKSPVLQSTVIDSRGGNAYEHISILEEMGFVTKEKSGRSFKLKITDKFFDYFDIAGNKDLRDVLAKAKRPEEKPDKPDGQTTIQEAIPETPMKQPEGPAPDQATLPDAHEHAGEGVRIEPPAQEITQETHDTSAPAPTGTPAEHDRKDAPEEHNVDVVLEKVEREIIEITSRKKRLADKAGKKTAEAKSADAKSSVTNAPED